MTMNRHPLAQRNHPIMGWFFLSTHHSTTPLVLRIQESTDFQEAGDRCVTSGVLVRVAVPSTEEGFHARLMGSITFIGIIAYK